jgi:hypothetical protein
MTNPNDFAFPIPGCIQIQEGLTKHEAFVMAAMMGLAANPKWWIKAHDIAPLAVEVADATIAEMNRTEVKS